MALSFSFNPFTGNFDEISTVSIGSPANGLSITGAQVLTIDLSSTSTTGALSNTDWNTFNNKQPAGNYITALTGDVTASGPGSVAATLANIQHKVYVDFINGSDSNTGTIVQPWKTVQHAYNSISPTINEPYVIYLSGGNNDTDSPPITGKPNVSIVSDYPIQIQAITISGGTTNDSVLFSNLVILGALTWIRNDNSVIGMQLNQVQMFSGPIFKQQGGGSASLTAYNSVSVNADLLLPRTGSFFFNHSFLGTTTFGDADSSAYYEMVGGYTSSAMSISGGVEAYFSGMQVDVPFGASLTAVTTGNGTPIFQTDSGSIPPTVTGSPTLNLISVAQHESYTPTTSSNWNSVPSTVLGGLDTLATSGVVKSQSQNLVLASPNGSSGLPSFRALVAADLPAVSPGAISLTNTHVLVGNASNVAADVAMSGDATIANTGALTLATVNGNVGSFTYSSITVNAKGLITAASSGAAPVTTLAAVGASPNANAGTISGNTLNLQPFDSTHPGVVTASGGGTANFLRADGTWATPPDTGITQLTGDVTAGPGSGSQAATIASHAVTNAKFRQSAALSLVGNSTNATADVADIAAASDFQIMRRSGTAIGFGSIDLSQSNAVGASVLANANTTATSANTASTIVARDGSGNFSAGTITAALTGTASGNTTISGQTNHGVVVASSTNAMTSTAAGTSGQPLLSGGAAADPAYGTLGISFGGTGQTTKAAAFDALSPMTTKGDIIAYSTTGARLAVGSNGQVLTADSAQTLGVKWATPGNLNVITNPASPYTAGVTDGLILMDASGGAKTINLYAASGNAGAVIRIKKTDSSSNTVTIDANASETIDGALTKVMYTQYEEFTLICDGSNWYIEDHFASTPLTSYTPGNGQGFGTPTFATSAWSRNGQFMDLYVSLTTGTVTASEARVNLPNSWTIASAMGTTSVVGAWSRQASHNNMTSVLATSGNSYVTFGWSSTGSGQTSQNGSTILGSANTFGFWCRVSITQFEP